MRGIKVLMVTLTLAASMVVGVAGSADAAKPTQAQPMTRWCC